ncbi:MAG: HD domain-containing protein [Paludibacteraceae bacterium]|nr:HD domain-containing protein [Paludibacteraceae bacterium]
METVEKIKQRMMAFYGENPPVDEQVRHTLDVTDYTVRLAKLMGLDQRQTDLLTIAALLHDVGCPKARELYGKALPPYQEKFGREIAEAWLTDYAELSADERTWLANVVGYHHHPRQATEMGFRPLFEADTIVNMYEGYYKQGQEQHVYDTLLETDEGKSLFAEMFLKK